MNATTTLYIVNGSTTSTIENFPVYNGMNLEESLFISCIIIALLSFSFYRSIFGTPSPKI